MPFLGPWMVEMVGGLEKQLAIIMSIHIYLVNYVCMYTCIYASYLFAGGQGLRGGDRSLDTPPTVNNCCLFCLQRLVKHAETLEHFLLHCPLQECSLQDVKPHLHRIMDDRQYFASMRVGDLRKLQDAMVASWQIRKMWLQGNGLKKPRSCMEFARANW